MAHRLIPSESALALVDWQEKLFGAMPEGVRDRALTAASTLRWLAGELSMPVVVSEQYPRGLGPTLPALDVSGAVEKLTFSAMATPAFADRVRGLGRRQVLVTGMETHICVAQTCRDLLDAGYEVWLVADACLSRRDLDWRTGIQRIERDGAMAVTTEAAAFELVGAAGSPVFKELSRRIR